MNFSGLFEIHLTVESDNYIELWKIARKNNYKLIHAVSKYGNQYMISKFSNRNSLEEILQKTDEVKKTLVSLNIIRTKIEMYPGSTGIPETCEEYKELSEKLSDDEYSDTIYFEFHLKVDGGDYEELNEICKKSSTARSKIFISVNLCSKDKDIILTIRTFNGRKKAIEVKNNFLNKLKELGYKFKDKIQEEFCIHDDNLDLDNPF